jgi:WD40 repeat protein
MRAMRTKQVICLLASLWVAGGGVAAPAQPPAVPAAVAHSEVLRTYLSAPEDPNDPRQEGLSGLVFGPDGYTAITGSSKYGGLVAVRIWDLRQAHGKPIELAEHSGPLDAIDLSSDGKLLASGDYDGIIRLWNLVPKLKKIVGFRWFRYQVRALALSPKSDLLAASGDGGVIGLMDLSRPSQSPVVLRGHANLVTSLAFSSDGRSLASSSADGTIRVWAIGKPNSSPVVLRGHQPNLHPANKNYDQNHVNKVVFTRDGRFLVAGAGDGSVQIWDATRLAKPPKVFHAHDRGVDSVSVNRDSTLLATAGRDHKILLWNLSNLDAPPRLVADCGKDWATQLVFEPTGTYLGAVIDGAVQLFRVKPIAPQEIIVD